MCVPDLASTRDFAWLLDPVLAKLIAKKDHENGGHPKVDLYEARRCHRCGMLRVGELARGRRRLDESAVDGRDLPCNPQSAVALPGRLRKMALIGAGNPGLRKSVALGEMRFNVPAGSLRIGL